VKTWKYNMENMETQHEKYGKREKNLRSWQITSLKELLKIDEWKAMHIFKC
jgi:hypothetical protein